MKLLPSMLMNKYLLSAIGFVVWMFFFEDRDLTTTYIKHPGELMKLQQSKAYYEQQINTTRLELKQLKSDAATIEKYAREKYFMKRDNEDLYVIPQ
jgi:cell division protein FtsB